MVSNFKGHPVVIVTAWYLTNIFQISLNNILNTKSSTYLTKSIQPSPTKRQCPKILIDDVE